MAKYFWHCKCNMWTCIIVFGSDDYCEIQNMYLISKTCGAVKH